MQRICRTIEKVAPTSATVMVLGESGTGKELFARALHDLSPRAVNRFVAINCAAIPDTLLESELFGYEKGAFTGAVKQTPGKIETAHKADALSRRDRRPADVAAGEAAALPAGARDRAHRRAAGDPRRRAHRLRDAHGPEGSDRRRQVPRGPVLPFRRDRRRAFRRFARARAMRRFSRTASCAATPRSSAAARCRCARCGRRDRGARVARQRARARERRQARGDHGGRHR